jgi:hypothetical protein
VSTAAYGCSLNSLAITLSAIASVARAETRTSIASALPPTDDAHRRPR